jgi:hypothetical protein
MAVAEQLDLPCVAESFLPNHHQKANQLSGGCQAKAPQKQQCPRRGQAVIHWRLLESNRSWLYPSFREAEKLQPD